MDNISARRTPSECRPVKPAVLQSRVVPQSVSTWLQKHLTTATATATATTATRTNRIERLLILTILCMPQVEEEKEQKETEDNTQR